MRRDRPVLKVVMPDGAFGIPEKHALWHQFSHWTYKHAVTSGQPAWLNEGLAEYFAVKETTGKPEDNPCFVDMVKRLADGAQSGKVWDSSLLDAPGLDSISREQSDTAWLLVKVLMEAEPKLIDTLFGAAFTLESFAVTVGDGVVKDIIGSVARMTREGLPDAKASMLLQQGIAWLSERKKPAKTVMVAIKPLVCRFLLKAKIKAEPREQPVTNPTTGTTEANDYFLEGEVTSLLADSVSLTLRAACADGHDIWSSDVTVMSDSVVPREKKEFRRQINLPVDVRKLRVSLYWTSGNGGKYVRRYECGIWASIREE
jgi:hypothetical protein